MKNHTRSWAIGIASLAISCAAAAQTLPSSLHIVVPFPPGGANDLLARVIAQPLGQELGVSVIVENRNIGAAGSVAAKAIANGPADGSTLLLGNTASLGINSHIYKNIGYDPRTDLEPVAALGTSALVLVVDKTMGTTDVPTFIQKLKNQPDQYTYASAGPGTPMHLSGEMFKLRTGTDMVHVPYKGTAPAYIDLIAGRVNAMFDNTTTAIRQVSAGLVNALAVTGTERNGLFPDTPTFKELGVAGMDDMTVWFGFVAPKGTPEPIRARIAEGVKKALHDPKVQEQFQILDVRPWGSTPQELKVHIGTQYNKWGELIKDAKIQMD